MSLKQIFLYSPFYQMEMLWLIKKLSLRITYSNSKKHQGFRLPRRFINRVGILTQIDGAEEGEYVTMLLMPAMLNS